MIYCRLLGRLAWCCSGKAPVGKLSPAEAVRAELEEKAEQFDPARDA